MVKLGDKVKDSITGFEGVAIGRTEYLYGCVSVWVQSTTLEGGEPKSHWIDEQRLEVQGSIEVPVSETTTATSGGPQPTAPARSHG